MRRRGIIWGRHAVVRPFLEALVFLGLDWFLGGVGSVRRERFRKPTGGGAQRGRAAGVVPNRFRRGSASSLAEGTQWRLVSLVQRWADRFFPGVAVNLDAAGDLEVFAVDQTHNISCIRQKTPGGHEWSNWKNLGGPVSPGVVVGQDADGRLEVFALDATDGAVKHLWQTNLHGEWSRWSDLGRGPCGGLAVTGEHDKRLDLFGVDEKQHLVHCWQRQTNNSSDWSGWASLGGAILPGLAAGQNADGQLEIFAVNATNNRVERTIQSEAGDSARWTAWSDFGGNVRPGLAVGQNADGRLGIFAVENGGAAVRHRWQRKPQDDSWTSWVDWGGTAQPTPVIGCNHDGTLEVFAIDEQNASVVDHRRQIIANHDYFFWSSMDRSPPAYSPRVWQTDEGLPNNRVQAIAQMPDGYLWVGTLEGLARFDGVEFKTYNRANTPELRNDSITALCPDAAGALWVGTGGGGVARLQQGRFLLFTAQDGLAGDDIRAIAQSPDGAVWIASTRGLSCLRDGKFQSYTTREGLLSDQVTALHQDRAGVTVGGHDPRTEPAARRGDGRVYGDQYPGWIPATRLDCGSPGDGCDGGHQWAIERFSPFALPRPGTPALDWVRLRPDVRYEFGKFLRLHDTLWVIG